MTEFHELSALEASAKIKSGDLTAEALMRSCFERIDERDELVGAWSYVDKDRAISEAIKSDKAGNPGLLGGLPVAAVFLVFTLPYRPLIPASVSYTLLTLPRKRRV